VCIGTGLDIYRRMDSLCTQEIVGELRKGWNEASQDY
jgi:hypothetical protein